MVSKCSNSHRASSDIDIIRSYYTIVVETTGSFFISEPLVAP